MRGLARFRGLLLDLLQRIEDTDFLIAASGLRHDLVIVTRRFWRFGGIPV